jgi:hypothetical protein
MAQPARKPPTPQQIHEQQTKLLELDKKQAETLPAVRETKLPAVPDNRTAHDAYLDDIAPATIVGRMVKFDGKLGKFVTPDDSAPVDEETDFIALCDQTLIGYVKFGAKGEPPTKEMGLLYDGFIMPDRSSLGDTDMSAWEMGLDGKPADPWQHHIYLVLQKVGTDELFTYCSSSATGRRAIGTLLRHYDRMQRGHTGYFPLIRLKVGGFQHRDDRVGWVNAPVLAAIGRVPGSDAVAPPPNPGEFNDDVPF